MSNSNSQSEKMMQVAVGDVVMVDSTTHGDWVEATVVEVSVSLQALRVQYPGVVNGKPVTLEKYLYQSSDRLEVPNNSGSMACTNRLEHDPEVWFARRGQEVENGGGAG